MHMGRSLALSAAAAGSHRGSVERPLAAAEEYGGGSANNPLMPGCEVTGGSSVTGGQDTDCASPGTPNFVLRRMTSASWGAEVDQTSGCGAGSGHGLTVPV